ncbi:uncharacterized protein LOC131737988 [Acipenser ruthenus]|uniref:uncharacterized protein LOC131737988 n=1 Tax=Acipenser ruthenus TaxID=7906 RepID=UPI00274296BF|nr:uncharacterized protein LOC131737988 [Acipenser ruthenus]
MKAMLFEHGHVVSALEFNVSWDEQAVLESIKNTFSEKLSSCRIEILLGCHNKLVKPSLTPGQKLSGHMLKKIFTQRSIYVRPDRVLLELGGKRAENSDEDIIDVTEAHALSFSSVQPSVCVENTSQRENMSSKSTFADDHSLPSESHICRSESVTAKTSVCEDTYRNYVDLLDTGSLSDDSDLNEAISRSLVDIQPMLEESCSLKEILKPFENSLSSEVVRYNITRRNVWDGTVRAMSRPNFLPTKQMDIKFTDNEGISEGAVDLGGPKREFLRLVLEYVRDHSGMFEGTQGKKVLACSIAALKGNSYFYAGQLMAMSVIHGGPPPQFLSPVLTEALICGPDKVIVSAEDVANEEIRSQIILVSC